MPGNTLTTLPFWTPAITRKNTLKNATPTTFLLCELPMQMITEKQFRPRVRPFPCEEPVLRHLFEVEVEGPPKPLTNKVCHVQDSTNL